MTNTDTRFCRPASARLLVLGFALIAGLAACNDEKPRAGIDQHASEAQQAMQDMNKYAPVKRYNPLVVTNKAWAGTSAMHMHRGLPLPSKYEVDRGITLVSSEPMTIADIANAVSVQTGIPVRVADGGGGAAGAASATASKNAMPVAYEGPLSGLLERTAGYFGVNWRYDGSIISITRFETRVFVVEALPGTQSVSEGMQDDQGGGGSSGGSSGGGSSSSTSSITQNSKFTIDFKYWDELDQILTSMLGGTGTIVSSPSIGTVTITTTPEIMRTVADYITKENERLSRQIAISVEIYSVTLKEGTDFNVSFNTVLNRLKNFGANIASGSAPSSVSGFTGAGSLSVAILNPFPSNTLDGNNSFGTNPEGGFSKGVGKVTDVFTALSGIGDTTKVAKFPLVTLNNRPASRRVGQDIGYVASSTSSAGTATTTGTTSLTPGTIHQGFSVQLTPRLLDDGRILLQYSLSVIDNNGLSSFNSTTGSCNGAEGACTGAASGSATIQLPNTQNRIFVQQSILKSGSMLLLGGAEEEDLQHNSQGVGDAYNYMLGGGTSSGRTHTMLFMAITPQVLEEPHSEQD